MIERLDLLVFNPRFDGPGSGLTVAETVCVIGDKVDHGTFIVPGSCHGSLQRVSAARKGSVFINAAPVG
jgi:hypothetical protein